MVEEQALKKGEVEGLKGELRDVVVAQKEGVRGVVRKVEDGVEGVKHKAEGVKDEARKKGWWPW